MKMILIATISIVLSSTCTSWAGMIQGELTKIDGSFYVVKDKDGKEHRIHFDSTTQKTGDVKAGANVKVVEGNGQAKSITVLDLKIECERPGAPPPCPKK
jgi:hypothetical protein